MTVTRTRRRLTRRGQIILATLLGAIIVLAAVSLGGSSHQTAVQKCTGAYQAFVNAGLNGQTPAAIRQHGTTADVQLLNAAQKACDTLTPAQARSAAAGLYP